jgi:hypothetical protein
MIRRNLEVMYALPVPTTVCFLDNCREVGHVVLYASGDRLAGQITYERQPIVFCLKHGGQVYDVMRAWKKVDAMAPGFRRNGGEVGKLIRHSAPCPTWLIADLRNDRLPRTSPDPKGWPPASPLALFRNRPQKGR